MSREARVQQVDHTWLGHAVTVEYKGGTIAGDLVGYTHRAQLIRAANLSTAELESELVIMPFGKIEVDASATVTDGIDHI